jgi:hypothetical protein
VRYENLQTRFCERFKCPPERYRKRAFKQLFHARAKMVAPVISLLNPAFFDQDLRFIENLGESTDLREAKVTAADFQDANTSKRSLLRTRLKIRVSGWKATVLATQLFT